MAIEVFNRTEIKYQLNDKLCHEFRERLKPYMEADAYSKGDDCYLISNIYYDTPDNELIRRSLDKPVYKEKLRLRSYGTRKPEDTVFLEVKKKYDGIVNKRRTKIILQDAYRFIDNKTFTNADGTTELPEFMNTQVMKELTYFVNCYRNIQPALYLSYERSAMFSKTDSNLRMTFDRNIKTRRYDLGLHYGDYGDLLLPEGIWIMEIKADAAIPVWLTELLTEYKVFPNTFSKYGTEYSRTMKEKLNLHEKKQEVLICSNQLSDLQQPMGQYTLEHR